MMHEPYIFSGTKERLDDAFYEMSVIEEHTRGLENKYSELKKEILQLQDEVKSIRIGVGLLLAAIAIAEIIRAVM